VPGKRLQQQARLLRFLTEGGEESVVRGRKGEGTNSSLEGGPKEGKRTKANEGEPFVVQKKKGGASGQEGGVTARPLTKKGTCLHERKKRGYHRHRVSFQFG